MAALFEKDFFRTLADCIKDSLEKAGDVVERVGWFLESWGDPNDWRLVKTNAVGSHYLPLTTRNHARTGTREFILETARQRRNLRVELNALATKVLFDENKRAIGVEYSQGENLYRACSQPNQDRGETRTIYASEEVILAGGAFNTPQLLMLSGIGAREELDPLGIRVLVDLPGVGKNLQDRYEISVGNRMTFPQWELYDRVTFSTKDPQFRQWNLCRTGIYATNGSVLSFFKRSPAAEGPPDLFCMALLANFQGYTPNYSKLFARDLNYLTWVVLKAHTRNRAGSVRLRSDDPRDMPQINFRYFEEGTDQDLDAVVDGVRFVRALTAELKEQNLMSEEFPGDGYKTDEELKTFIRNNAWGHHSSCTSAIGTRNKGGMVWGDFRVHRTTGLRVVDASVFPRIPGVFIVSAIYMVGEKAAEVILSGR
jgi:choline dehydrogenase-like flavoprotein